mmetsp:Transcript_51501/g.145157  ORF Transcript_51501/g.145157 Transcript_51501/m.145157 type:complete len:223 (-) Transcript_51501:1081-1749(-)
MIGCTHHLSTRCVASWRASGASPGGSLRLRCCTGGRGWTSGRGGAPQPRSCHSSIRLTSASSTVWLRSWIPEGGHPRAERGRGVLRQDGRVLALLQLPALADRRSREVFLRRDALKAEEQRGHEAGVDGVVQACTHAADHSAGPHEALCLPRGPCPHDLIGNGLRRLVDITGVGTAAAAAPRGSQAEDVGQLVGGAVQVDGPVGAGQRKLREHRVHLYVCRA